MRAEHLARNSNTSQINIEDSIPFIIVNFQKWSRRVDAGSIDQDVAASACLIKTSDHVLEIGS